MSLPKGYGNYAEELRRKQEAANTSMSKLIQTLKDTTEKRVDALDYNAQIDRWNAYQKVLDTVNAKCDRRNKGTWLQYNIKYNMATFTNDNQRGMGVLGGIASIVITFGLISHNPYVYGVGLGMGAVALREFLIRYFPPKTLRFKCSPVLHIDEMTYARTRIDGIEAVQHDPEVKLPVLEMKIPRKWIGQQGMLELMDGLKDIEW